MGHLPRIAVGPLEPGTIIQPLLWGLLGALQREAVQVQQFVARACFCPVDSARAITGLSTRHLDTWLMSRPLCRELFYRAASAADLALIAGPYEPADSANPTGGSLAELCHWLDCPRLGILDAAELGRCRMPDRPPGLQGLLLDNVRDATEFYSLQTGLESLWGVPVLGGLESLPRLRQAIRAAPFEAPSPELTSDLAERLLRFTPLERLRRLAGRQAFDDVPPRRLRTPKVQSAVRVAVAYDSAFHCYFPDTLDLLELHGASVVNFSPLRDERLPAETDVVYLGCGDPERFAADLAANHCMLAALRNHVCTGKRLYAEGGGLAYVCRQIEMPDGARLPMAGVIPAVARRSPHSAPPQAVEVTVAQGSWLARAGTRLRGYANSTWEVVPQGELTDYLTPGPWSRHLVGRHHTVGSRLHLDFAALPNALRGFLRTHAASLDCGTQRQAVQ